MSSETIDILISRLRSPDENTSGPAWQTAAPLGAAAVKPLGTLLTDPEFETARNAKRALYQVVRYATRPGAKAEAISVQTELVALLNLPNSGARRHVLWMLSEIADRQAVPPIAALLSDPEVWEDARCALMRIPHKDARVALEKALASAPHDFNYALADSLRALGRKVSAYPTRKLIPTRQTAVAAKPQ
jgi:HEAT repeat protein